MEMRDSPSLPRARHHVSELIATGQRSLAELDRTCGTPTLAKGMQVPTLNNNQYGTGAVSLTAGVLLDKIGFRVLANNPLREASPRADVDHQGHLKTTSGGQDDRHDVGAVPGVVQCVGGESDRTGHDDTLEGESGGQSETQQRAERPARRQSQHRQAAGEGRPISDWLRQWTDEDRYTNADRPAFVFFYRFNTDGPLMLGRQEVYTLAKRYAYRLTTLLREHYPDGLADVYVCNTLPASPARVITDLGVLLAGGISVAGPTTLKEWKRLEAHFRGDATYCQVMIVAERSDMDVYVSQWRHSFSRGPVLDRVLPIFSPSPEDTARDLLKELGAMSPQEEMETYVAGDQCKVVWILPGREADSPPALIAYQERGLCHLGRQLREILSLDPSRDVLLNPCAADLLWGFPLAYLFCGTTVALPDRFLEQASNYADSRLSMYYFVDDVFIDWRWLASQSSVKAFFHSDAVYEMVAHGELLQASQMKMSRMAVCGLVSEKLLEILGDISRQVCVAYCSEELGFVSHLLLEEGAGYVPGDMGRTFPGVRMRFTHADHGREVEQPKPACLLLQIPRLPLRQLLVLDDEHGSWRDIPSDDWWPTQTLAYLSHDGHLHIVGRSRWKVYCNDYKKPVPLATLEMSCTRQREFLEVVFVEVVVGSSEDPENPLHSEVIACATIHRNVWTTRYPAVQADFRAIQDSLDLSLSDLSPHVLILNEMPKLPDGRPNRLLIAKMARSARKRGQHRAYTTFLAKQRFTVYQRPVQRVTEGLRSAWTSVSNFVTNRIPRH